MFEDNTPISICLYLLKLFKHGTVYYAHNLKFDFLLFFRGLIQLNIKFSWFFLETDLYEVTITHCSKKIILRCSYKLLPFKLKSFYPGLSPYQKLSFPYESLLDWNPKNLCSQYKCIDFKYHNLTIGDYLMLYSKNDVQILKCGITTFFKTLKALNIKYNSSSLTCGSIALNFFCSKYNTINLKLPQALINNLKRAYYGGRCEVFGNKLTHEKVLHFDFTGMYHMCMLEDIPFGDFKYETTNLNINIPGYYYITIEYYTNMPILPEKTNKLMFRDGVVTGLFWYEEILYTVEFCQIKFLKIHYGFISLKNGPFLRNFIQELAAVRGLNIYFKDIGKLLINSFYGRLGLTNDLNLIQLTKNLKNEKDYGMIEDFYLKKNKIYRPVKGNIAIAAAITSKARIKLYKAFKDVEDNSGRLLYCDTDSVFASFPLNCEIENKKLKYYIFFDTSKKDTIIEDCVFIKPKTYGLKMKDGTEIIKIKGINIPSLNLSKLKDAFFNNQTHIKMQTDIISTNTLNVLHILQNKDIYINDYSKRQWDLQKIKTTPFTNKP